MSFECKYLNNNYCELRKKECKPGEKGCILNKNRVIFINDKNNENKKE